jgi:hypothetical protein
MSEILVSPRPVGNKETDSGDLELGVRNAVTVSQWR